MLADLALVALYAAMIGAPFGAMWAEPRLRARAARRRNASWSKLAAERGLDWHEVGQRLSGWDRDRYVAAWTEPGSARQVPSSWAAAVLWPPLDLGLNLKVGETFWNAAGAHHALDADDRERAKHLLVPELRNALSAASPRLVSVTDDRVLLGSASVIDRTEITASLDHARAIAREIDAARARVPVLRLAAQADALDGWTRLGHALHFGMTNTPFGFSGHQRGLELRFFVKRTGRLEYAMVVMASFREPLRIGFSARPHWDASDPPWSTERVTTRDAEFDQRFRVDAVMAEYVQAVLGDLARRRLCELSARWNNVFVDDYGVRVETEIAASEQVQEMLAQVAGVADVVDFVRPERSAVYR